MSLDPRSPFHADHPLAGKIATGVRTTESRARAPNVSMPMSTVPTVTMQDRAQQMFGMKDAKGTRVYYAPNGIFNTVDEQGVPITFIQGLFKTTDRSICSFLQHFVDKKLIHYLELQEDPSDDDTKCTEGSPSSNATSDESDKQESEYREKSASIPDRSRAGGEGTPDAEQLLPGATISSSGGAGNDGGRQEIEPAQVPSLKDRLAK